MIVGEHLWEASQQRIAALPFPRTVEDLLCTYQSIDLAIGWRFHMLVLASLFGRKSAFIGLLDEHKYRAFCLTNGNPMFDFEKPNDALLDEVARYIEAELGR